MTPTTITPPPVPTAKPRRKRGRAVRISEVSWDQYEALTKVFADRPRLHVTYDQGDLEITVTSQAHEGDSSVLAHLIAVLAGAFQLPLKSGGSVTMKRKRMKKALEPDKCYWLANAAQIVGVKQLDLDVHPPPDLAIEVDVSRSSMNRFGIYAALGVPEVWRLDGDELHVYRLSDKAYAEVPTSATFPGIAPADVMAFVIQARGALDENAIVAAFRAWVQQRLAPPAP